MILGEGFLTKTIGDLYAAYTFNLVLEAFEETILVNKYLPPNHDRYSEHVH